MQSSSSEVISNLLILSFSELESNEKIFCSEGTAFFCPFISYFTSILQLIGINLTKYESFAGVNSKVLLLLLIVSICMIFDFIFE